MNNFKIAESAGFCFGVSRSVELAESVLDEYKQCYCLGQLIHNNDVVKRLSDKGLVVIDQPNQLTENSHVIIRSHGVSESTYKVLENNKVIIHDATCPKVSHIHKIVKNASEEGRKVIIIGMRDHPEVEAIVGWCNDCLVFESPDFLENWLLDNQNLKDFPFTVVCQTTQTKENFNSCVNIIKKICTNAKIFDTICNATFTRQNEAKELSTECDAMIVIGDKHSANSKHLAEICRLNCDNVQFIASAAELDVTKISNASIVGLTAGASVPTWLIKEVSDKMSDEIKELSFDEMLEESLKTTIYNGDTVTGTVVAITNTEINVDLGCKYSGFIPTNEFTDDGIKVEEAVKVGDQIQAKVVRVNDVEGTAQLSKRRLDAAKSWDDIEDASANGTVVEGTVVEENKGGVVVNVKGARIFVPASQTGLPREAEMKELLKKKVRLVVTEVNRSRKRVVGSIKRVTQAERRVASDAIWNEIEVGKKYNGVVKSMTKFGAFVDIGGIDGMVHVSELSWSRISDPSEVLSVGQEIEVYVISFDKEKRKISLGYKDPNGNPWTVFTTKYNLNDVASVKIVKLMPFGAFAEVVPGVDGLIHISQMADRRIGKPEEVLAVGDVVDAKITAVDEERKKVSLSIRALSEPEQEEVVAEEETEA